MPFDLSEAHYFEATFYDELTPSGKDSTSRPVGIPLPSWQDIENNPEMDMRSNCQMVIWGIVYDETPAVEENLPSSLAKLSEEPPVITNFSPDVELETINLSDNPNIQ
nr:hypothetical protein CFP56_48623 [Quercus suber]